MRALIVIILHVCSIITVPAYTEAFEFNNKHKVEESRDTKKRERFRIVCIDGYKFVESNVRFPEWPVVQLWENTPNGPRPAVCTERRR
ncbi:hypothetical protein [Desulfovibrio sp. An276]|uniref:hypothetical protein n=1 Tax=Desulfovibrio sp. An276 TaxID=1965618 RepID=UPI00118473B1|nr:hypothetical protein [Desulfovibrio sp. An276]